MSNYQRYPNGNLVGELCQLRINHSNIVKVFRFIFVTYILCVFVPGRPHVKAIKVRIATGKPTVLDVLWKGIFKIEATQSLT